MADEPLNRRELAAHATRAALLRSARQAFAERGYAAVGLNEIARGANATTGAIYHHFGDKQGIFLAVAERVEAEILQHILASAPPGAKPWDLLRFAVLETLATGARPGVARIIFKEAPSVFGAARWREIEMRYGFGGMHRLLQQIQAEGELAMEDVSLIAGIILGALIQAAEAVARDERPATLADAQDAMGRLLDAFRR